MEGAARARGEPGAPGRGQLRERLLRRHPRHRRRPGRPDAAGRLRGRLAGGGEAGGVPGVRRRGCRRAGARGLHRLVAGRRRPRVGARRVVLHRRLPPLRLPRPRRGDGVRLLRPGRGGRHDVRPDRDLRAALPCTPRSGSARSPARSSWSTTCATSRPTPSPASAPSRSSSAPTARVGSTCCSCWPPSVACVAVAGLHHLVGAARPRLPRCPPLRGVRTVLSGAVGPALVPVLQSTGLAELVWAVLVAVPLTLG